MQLLKVYSNKKSFRTIEFNERGLNFILAKQQNPGSNDDGKTYNGVGKSLLVKIIHFCFGASLSDYKVFCEKLPDWVFAVDFKYKDQVFKVSRGTGEPEKVLFNEKEMSLPKFRSEMEKICFDIPDDTKFLSFRSLIPFFIRPAKKSYVECMEPGKTGGAYQTMLYNSFLIGLDVNLADQKFSLRKEQSRIADLEKNFRKDSLLKDFFTGDKDVSLTLADLNDRISRIEKNIQSFKVADDYHDIQKRADKTEKELFELNNEIALVSSNIKSVEKSIKKTPNVNDGDLEEIYSEVCFFFPDSVNKTLEEIRQFYHKLIDNRIRRLSEQKLNLQSVLKEKNERSDKLKKELDNNMAYLGEHQAIDIFVVLSKELADLKSKKENLEKYKELQSEYKAKQRKIEKNIIEISEVTDNYLNDMEEVTEGIKDTFRKLAKTFYNDSVAGLTIKTNDGENQLVYKIEPKIESDASDGINNVKLFCYDLSILFQGKNHNVGFLFHDSRLYDGIDELHLSKMFKIIDEYFGNSKKQYISTINQNHLRQLEEYLTEEEYKNIIEKNTILTLTDESDSEKLLGIKVDIG